MSVFVFVGPSLPADEVRREIDATCLPPAAQGDVYRAAAAAPRAIGLIDGYFESVPAVWHKEILWALSRGVHVFGAASMGALRAAELADFGMIGVGKIYEQFADGHLDDDDEVAVTHAPAELGFRPVSEALVNIRATLAAAEASRAIPPALHRDLLRIAMELHYPFRTYEGVIELARERGLPEAPLRELERWLPGGQVDQKGTDALAMLAVMRLHLAANPEPHRPSFTFEPTRAWARMVEEADGDEPPTFEEPLESPVRHFLRRLLE